MIVATFPPDERGKAVGAWTAWGGIGTVLGPVIGGQLVDAASWRWIFAINVPIVIVTIVLILRVVPVGRERDPDARVDVVGRAAVRARAGRDDLRADRAAAARLGRPAGRRAAAGASARCCSRASSPGRRAAAHPMLPLGLFRRRNFAVGNFETFPMYGGLGLLFFFLVLFLQQVAGFSALEAGSSSIPVTLVMFALSMRFGALADRYGPRFFMGVGPLIAAVRHGAASCASTPTWTTSTDLLPGLLVFALGLSMTVAPLTATVLADADESNAGIASGVNNAIARVAGLVAIAAVGAVVAASFGSPPRGRARRAGRRRGRRWRARWSEAKTQPLAAVPVQGVPRATSQASVQRGGRGRLGRRRSTSASGSRRCWSRSAGSSACSGSPTRAGASRPPSARAASSWASRARARASRPATGTSICRAGVGRAEGAGASRSAAARG